MTTFLVCFVSLKFESSGPKMLKTSTFSVHVASGTVYIECIYTVSVSAWEANLQSTLKQFKIPILLPFCNGNGVY